MVKAELSYVIRNLVENELKTLNAETFQPYKLGNLLQFSLSNTPPSQRCV